MAKRIDQLPVVDVATKHDEVVIVTKRDIYDAAKSAFRTHKWARAIVVITQDEFNNGEAKQIWTQSQ